MDAEDFKQFLVVKRSLDSSSTRKVIGKLNGFKNFLRIENLPLSKQSAEQFLYSVKIRTKSHSTYNGYIMMMKHLYAYYSDRGETIEDFSKGLTYLKAQKTIIVPLSLEECEKLFATDLKYGRVYGDVGYLNRLYKTVTLFIYSTGCRLNEAQSLTVGDCDLFSGRISFYDTKNGDNREVYIPSTVCEELRPYVEGKQPSELVFQNTQGSPIHQSKYNEDIKRRAKKAGIKKYVKAHLLRHSFGTHLYQATKDIGLVQLALGHKDIKSTMIYIHLAQEYIKDGMMKHPFALRTISPSVAITMTIKDIDSHHLEQDKRFDPVKVMQARHQFEEQLMKALVS